MSLHAAQNGACRRSCPGFSASRRHARDTCRTLTLLLVGLGLGAFLEGKLCVKNRSVSSRDEVSVSVIRQQHHGMDQRSLSRSIGQQTRRHLPMRLAEKVHALCQNIHPVFFDVGLNLPNGSLAETVTSNRKTPRGRTLISTFHRPFAPAAIISISGLVHFAGSDS